MPCFSLTLDTKASLIVNKCNQLVKSNKTRKAKSIFSKQCTEHKSLWNVLFIQLESIDRYLAFLKFSTVETQIKEFLVLDQLFTPKNNLQLINIDVKKVPYLQFIKSAARIKNVCSLFTNFATAVLSIPFLCMCRGNRDPYRRTI